MGILDYQNSIAIKKAKGKDKSSLYHSTAVKAAMYRKPGYRFTVKERKSIQANTHANAASHASPR
jgi:hypothetical protein